MSGLFEEIRAFKSRKISLEQNARQHAAFRLISGIDLPAALAAEPAEAFENHKTRGAPDRAGAAEGAQPPLGLRSQPAHRAETGAGAIAAGALPLGMPARGGRNQALERKTAPESAVPKTNRNGMIRDRIADRLPQRPTHSYEAIPNSRQTIRTRSCAKTGLRPIESP
jgi:hypothetical protein